MAWFRHECSMSLNDKILRLEDKFGKNGYYIWCKTLELAYAHYWNEGPGLLTFDIRQLCASYRVRKRLLIDCYSFANDLQMINKLTVDGFLISFEIYNMAKYLPKDSKFARQKRAENTQAACLHNITKHNKKNHTKVLLVDEPNDSPTHRGRGDFIFKLWNDKCRDLPKASSYTAKRRTAANARWKENPDENFWIKAMDLVFQSDFLLGKNSRNWRANLDWFLRPGNAEKLHEGQYGKTTTTKSKWDISNFEEE